MQVKLCRRINWFFIALAVYASILLPKAFAAVNQQATIELRNLTASSYQYTVTLNGDAKLVYGGLSGTLGTNKNLTWLPLIPIGYTGTQSPLSADLQITQNGKVLFDLTAWYDLTKGLWSYQENYHSLKLIVSESPKYQNHQGLLMVSLGWDGTSWS